MKKKKTDPYFSKIILTVICSFVVFVLCLILTACTPYWAQEGQNPDSTVETVMDGGKIAPTPDFFTPMTIVRVVAEKGLRIRTAPDGHGGETILVMENGSEFHVQYCEEFDGQDWAYGTFRDTSGWASAEYLSKGACNG